MHLCCTFVLIWKKWNLHAFVPSKVRILPVRLIISAVFSSQEASCRDPRTPHCRAQRSARSPGDMKFGPVEKEWGTGPKMWINHDKPEDSWFREYLSIISIMNGSKYRASILLLDANVDHQIAGFRIEMTIGYPSFLAQPVSVVLHWVTSKSGAIQWRWVYPWYIAGAFWIPIDPDPTICGLHLSKFLLTHGCCWIPPDKLLFENYHVLSSFAN